MDEPTSPHTLKDVKTDSAYSVQQPPSPAKSTSSSSSGSYDIEDAMHDPAKETSKTSRSAQPSGVEQDVSL